MRAIGIRPARRAATTVVVALCCAASAFAATGTDGADRRQQSDPSAGEPVQAWELRGGELRRCPAIDDSDPIAPRGGCSYEVRSDPIDHTMHSMVGRVRFKNCLATHTLYVDGAGRTRMDLLMGGKPPCNDLRPCQTKAGREPPPWHGQLVRQADGALANVVDACLDTCLGIFEGKLVLPFERERGTWRIRAPRVPIGDSGWQLDGGWIIRDSGALTFRQPLSSGATGG